MAEAEAEACVSSSPLRCGDWLTFDCFVPMIADHDLVKKRSIMDPDVSTHTFLTMIIEESVCFMSCEPIFVVATILMWYTRNIHFFSVYIIFFINWTVRMSDNLPERFQILGHTHILCITVREHRIICCQIFCDLLLKSSFERIFNVMQLILLKIKWHIKWKYLIQKFHYICLSYYFKQGFINPCFKHIDKRRKKTKEVHVSGYI
jgi:hypothetical protein